MKMKVSLLAALVLFAASAATAVEMYGQRPVGSLTVINEDSRPHSVTVDSNGRSVEVFAGEGGATRVEPGQNLRHPD